MANEQTYQSEFTGQQMDRRFAAVAELTAALEALTAVVAGKYVKPADGIPSSDMTAAVQASLAKAESAVQSLADYYTKTEVDQLLAAINGMDYVDVSTLPTASASTMGKIYLLGPDASGYYAYYYTSYDGTDYAWVGPLGTTEISLAGYATKAELSQLNDKISQSVRKAPGYNIFDPSNITEHAAISNSGEVIVSSSYESVVSDFIPVDASTAYRSMIADGATVYFMRVAFYARNKSFISITSELSFQFTTPADCAFVRLRIGNLSFAHAGLIKGGNQIEYTPYNVIDGYVGEKLKDLQDNKIPIFPGENLLSDKSLVYNNFILDNDGNTSASSGYKTTDYIPVEQNTAYSNSIESGTFRKVAFYTSDYTVIPNSLVQNVATFITPGGCSFVRISISDARFPYFMLAKSSAPVYYKAYNPIEGYLPYSETIKEKVSANSRNLLGDVVDNALLTNDGSIASGDTYANYKTTGFIQVKEGTAYVGAIELGEQGYRKVCFYNSNKVNLGSSTTVQNVDRFTTPAGSSFVRVSVLASNADFLMIAEASEPIAYQPVNPISGYLPTKQTVDEKTLEAMKKVKMAEWSELQFGLFLHWGVYSAWAGAYTGQNIYGEEVSTTSGTEWIWHSMLIPPATYKAKASEFSSEGWDPDEICRMAKSVGMKYIVLTLRHHEGFSLFASDNCDWDVRSSSADADIVMRLKQACDRHHLKFCAYVSALLDWNDEGGWGQNAWNNDADPYTFEQHLSFTKRQVDYVKEVVEKFDPWVVWYDGGTYFNQPGSVKGTFYRGQLENFPYPIFNERGSGGADYKEAEDTYADNPGSTEKYERANNICGWSYNAVRNETPGNYKSVKNMLWDMLETFSRGFNYLLAVAPKGDGSIPGPYAPWFTSLANFFRKYTFFNGARRLYNYSQPSWGRTIYIDNSVYLFVIPGPSSIYVDSILPDNLKSVHIYGVSNPDSEMNWSVIEPDRIQIFNLPTESDDGYVVIRLDFYNDVTCQDYNIITDVISPRSIVRIKNQGWANISTGLLLTGIYQIGSDDNTIATRFKFAGTSGAKTIKLNGTISGSISLAVKVYNKAGTVLFSGTASNGSVTNVPLVSEEIYLIEVSKTGSGSMTVTSISIS